MSCSVCRQPGHKRGSEKCQPAQGDTVETAWIKATHIPASPRDSIDPFADDEPVSPLSAQITARVQAANQEARVAAERAKLEAAVERSGYAAHIGVGGVAYVIPSDHDDIAAHLVTSSETFEKVNLANVTAKFGAAMDEAFAPSTTRQEAIVANLEAIRDGVASLVADLETIRDAFASLAVLFDS